MNNIIFLIIILLFSTSCLKAQQDTIIYNQSTGNYIIQYFNEDDSLVTQTFIPWNKIKPYINCKVQNNNNRSEYVYEWEIKNGVESEQNLNSFIIDFGDSNITNYSTSGWYASRWHKPSGIGYMNRFSWSGDQGLEPTWQVGGFVIGSPGLPSIGLSYFQGTGGSILSFSDSPPPEKILKEVDKLDGFPEGYVQRKTVVPLEIPFLFVQDGFLDTIVSYTDSSYAFGWIADEQTREKYNTHFTNAKNYLNQNNNNAAKSTLQIVLNECNADSSTVLTSEAYALLYFNTEYLINQLPEGESGLPVKLIDSQGSLLTGGTLQYYDSGWQDATDNGNGTFIVQTGRETVSLKMTYAGGIQQLNNVIVGSDTAVFQTVNTTVKLLNSQNTPFDEGTVKYYANGWKDFGTATNGEATKELLPRNYSFRMTYENISNDKQQDIGSSPVVEFSSLPVTVSVKDGSGNPILNAEVQYYSKTWNVIGNTDTSGEISLEMLPKNITFRVKYNSQTTDKQQDTAENSLVEFIVE